MLKTNISWYLIIRFLNSITPYINIDTGLRQWHLLQCVCNQISKLLHDWTFQQCNIIKMVLNILNYLQNEIGQTYWVYFNRQYWKVKAHRVVNILLTHALRLLSFGPIGISGSKLKLALAGNNNIPAVRQSRHKENTRVVPWDDKINKQKAKCCHVSCNKICLIWQIQPDKITPHYFWWKESLPLNLSKR